MSILDPEMFAAIDIAKSKKRKSFRVSDLDTYTIAVLKYLADERGVTVAEVIAEEVCSSVNTYMMFDIVSDWLPGSVRAEAAREVGQRTTRANSRSTKLRDQDQNAS